MRDVSLGELICPARVARAGDSDFPLLSMTMHQGLVDQSGRFKKRIASQDVSEYKVVRRGQLVVGFPIDEGVLDFQELYPAGIVSPAYGVWDVQDEARVDRQYLKLALRSDRSFAYYRSKLRGSTARRRSLPADVFLALPISLPPLNEQRRIAAILDAADAISSKRKAVVANLDFFAQAHFVATFGDPRSWPDRWSMGRIRDHARSVSYGTSAKAGSAGGWPVLRMGNITDDGRLDLADLKYLDLPEKERAKYTLRRGDLLFNRTNSVEKVGKSAVVRTDETLAYAGYLVRVRFDNADVAEFVAAYLNSSFGRSIRRGRAKTAVNQANINATEMQDIPIAVPDGATIARFARGLEAINAQRATVQRALAADDELFASLQSRAFSGKL